jgi:hypothetical protein
MKNIWKFLMVAMMAIAMVGCPQPNNDGDGGNGGNGGNGGSTEGVYSFTITADMMGAFDENHAWGSEEGAFRTIKFILVPNNVEFEGDASFTDTNKIYVYAHNDIDNGRIYFNQFGDGALQVVSKVGADYYKAAAVKKSGDDYIVYFDMNKVALASLCAKGAAEGKRGKDKWNAFNTLVSNYTPYIIGNVTSNVYNEENPDGYDEFEVDMWNAGVVKMEKSSTPFPAVKVPTGIDYDTLPAVQDTVIDWTKLMGLRGTINNWGLTAIDTSADVMVATFDCDQTDEKFKVAYDPWDGGSQIASFEIAAIGTEQTVEAEEHFFTGGDPAAITFAQELTVGHRYEVKITKITGNTSFKILVTDKGETPAGDDSSSSEENNSSSSGDDNNSSSGDNNSSSGDDNNSSSGDNNNSSSGEDNNSSSGE